MTTGSPEGMNEIDETSIDPEEQGSQMQPYDTLDDRGVEDVLDEGIVPNQKWSPGQGFGNTAAEQREGETLDMRIAQEEPDVFDDAGDEENLEDSEVGGERAGRLVAPDEGAHEDAESDAVAMDVGIDGAGATAEEAALQVVVVVAGV
ncbi:DUF5709 domain-containing protein [Nocardioides caldifontis]|uniref:DUF5709 domain-containing protein n=1 Tax=Nocardioides caldifontis TaxID=2588938 RepID=UPI0011DF4CC2|nr:DUF5709 domain-containing protein [Nocardioides caldifontis]